MEKNVVVKVAGGTEPREAVIHPGTTCRDLLNALGLSRNLLLTSDPSGTPFGADEGLWDKVEDGSKLYAVPPMEVG